ncbi:MAG TPA: PQQ-dependent sugar dehydrogenase [Gemmatimonadales bacterium]
MAHSRRYLPNGFAMVPHYQNARLLVFLLVFLGLALGCDLFSEPRNLPPVVHITDPAGVVTVVENTPLTLNGEATDPEDGALSGTALRWSSSLDGVLGTGASIQIATLTPGNHVITLTATDSRDQRGSASVSVTVTPFVPGNQPPQVTITSPTSGASVTQSTAVNFTGSATDPEDGPLTGNSLAWSSSRDGALGGGSPLTVSTLSIGQHTITLRATDGAGAHTDATVTLTVTAPAVNLALDTVADGLNSPVFLTTAPGDPTRLFIVEKSGTIRIVENGSLLATPFLDISDSVINNGEQGLLGLAFDPNYQNNGRFFVSYSAPGGGAAGHSAIKRYLVSANPDLADPATGLVILTQDDPYTNHNGGMIGFGPDGYFYFGLGDGGGGGDPLLTGQNPADFFASMLRLDVSGSGTYTIPPSNPFATSQTAAHEVWAYGLRNPWRWSFDRQTGDLYIADVGQNAHEEVNVQPAASTGGQNYGWSIMEGLSCYGATTCNQSGLTLPVLDYDHGQGCSITGGYVYRGTAIPAIQGLYFYADYCTAFVRSFRWTGSGITEEKEWTSLDLTSRGGAITSFGEDAQGELYVLSQAGTVYRIVAR